MGTLYMNRARGDWMLDIGGDIKPNVILATEIIQHDWYRIELEKMTPTEQKIGFAGNM